MVVIVGWAVFVGVLFPHAVTRMCTGGREGGREGGG